DFEVGLTTSTVTKARSVLEDGSIVDGVHQKLIRSLCNLCREPLDRSGFDQEVSDRFDRRVLLAGSFELELLEAVRRVIAKEALNPDRHRIQSRLHDMGENFFRNGVVSSQKMMTVNLVLEKLRMLVKWFIRRDENAVARNLVRKCF